MKESEIHLFRFSVEKNAMDGIVHKVSAPLPLLLKAYLRLGTRARSEPCYDPDFHCTDILLLVNVHEIDASYTRHFLDRVREA